MKMIHFMLTYIKRHLSLWLIGMFVPPLAGFATNLYFANRLEILTTKILEPQPSFRNTATMLAASIPVLLLFSGIDDIGRFGFSLLVASMNNSVKQDLYCKITKIPLMKLQLFQKGELITRYSTDVDQISNIITNDIQGILYPLIVGIGYFIAVLYENIRIGVLMAFLGTAVIVLNFLFLQKMHHLQKELLQSNEAYNQNCSDALHGKMSIRQYSATKSMVEKISASAHMIYSKEQRMASLQALKILTSDGLADICTYLLTPLACLLAALGWINLPAVLFIHQICREFIRYTQNLANSFIEFHTHSLSYERLSFILYLFEEAEKNTTEKVLHNGEIAFENVSVSYGNKQVLNNVTFSIHSGEIVCLIGKSGSGKTTLVKALLQMVDYTGNISIGGINCREISLSALRDYIGFSPEHGDLFPTTVYENIKFGKPDATDTEIESAMKRAALHDRAVLEHREVGENSSLLSGGQRQKVSLARALLKNSPIMILDEPTAALDKESEACVLQTIQALGRDGKIILLITHRASTLQIADRVMYIENGKIREMGSLETC